MSLTKSLLKVSDSNKNLKKNYSLRIIVSIVIFLWCLGIISPYLLLGINHNLLLLKLLNYNYSLVCHQNDMKSVSVDGTKFLVCARCTGIYFGALFSSIILIFIYNLYFQNLLPLVSVSVLLLLDVIFTSLGVYNYSRGISITTGIIFGVILYIYTLEILEKFFTSNLLKQTNGS